VAGFFKDHGVMARDKIVSQHDRVVLVSTDRDRFAGPEIVDNG
jgi:hypothetical protein